MPSTIYLVTGGCRSGKSSYAQGLCERLCANPIYLATSSSKGDYQDADMADRVQRHQQDRGENWTTVEAPLTPSEHIPELVRRVVLVDCLTLWLTNYMLEYKAFSLTSSDEISPQQRRKAAENALSAIKEEFEKLTEPWNITYIFVTNELGSGTHASDAFSRTFVDHQGWFNQFVAAKASRVVHMISGCPSILKTITPRGAPKNAGVATPEDQDEAALLDKFLSSRSLQLDEKGYFLVSVKEDRIAASFHSCILNDKGEVCDLEGRKIPCCGDDKKKNRPEPMKVWKARTAKELTVAIFEDWKDASKLLTISHAAYIGREAQKAEHCLLSGLHFQQN